MCLIVTSSKGNLPDQEDMENALNQNSHGFGYVYLHPEKGLIGNKWLYASKEIVWAAFEEMSGMPYLAHFRLATHGDKSHSNTHPFEVVKDQLYVAHNGIIDIATPNPKYSDTWHFVEKFLKPRGLEILSEKSQAGLSLHLGFSNKLAFLDSTGKVTLINETQGHWYKDVWYSNLYSLYSAWDDSEVCEICYQECFKVYHIDSMEVCEECCDKFGYAGVLAESRTSYDADETDLRVNNSSIDADDLIDEESYQKWLKDRFPITKEKANSWLTKYEKRGEIGGDYD